MNSHAKELISRGIDDSIPEVISTIEPLLRLSKYTDGSSALDRACRVALIVANLEIDNLPKLVRCALMSCTWDFLDASLMLGSARMEFLLSVLNAEESAITLGAVPLSSLVGVDDPPIGEETVRRVEIWRLKNSSPEVRILFLARMIDYAVIAESSINSGKDLISTPTQIRLARMLSYELRKHAEGDKSFGESSLNEVVRSLAFQLAVHLEVVEQYLRRLRMAELRPKE